MTRQTLALPNQRRSGVREVHRTWREGRGALKRSITADNVNSLFTDVKTAFMISGPWQIPGLNKSGLKYDISPVPAFEGGKPAKVFVGVQCMYVASGSNYKSLAQEFATSFWTQRESVLALYQADPRPPALTAALEEIQQSEPNVQKVVKAGENGDILPAIPHGRGHPRQGEQAIRQRVPRGQGPRPGHRRR
jgi:arabinogalactan oligomer/maltooligosaccharide transport system substrate-binding protein